MANEILFRTGDVPDEAEFDEAMNHPALTNYVQSTTGSATLNAGTPSLDTEGFVANINGTTLRADAVSGLSLTDSATNYVFLRYDTANESGWENGTDDTFYVNTSNTPEGGTVESLLVYEVDTTDDVITERNRAPDLEMASLTGTTPNNNVWLSGDPDLLPALFDNGDKGVIQIDQSQVLQDPDGADTGGNQFYGLAIDTPAASESVNAVNVIYEGGEQAGEFTVRGANPVAALYLKATSDDGGTDADQAPLIRAQPKAAGVIYMQSGTLLADADENQINCVIDSNDDNAAASFNITAHDEYDGTNDIVILRAFRNDANDFTELRAGTDGSVGIADLEDTGVLRSRWGTSYRQRGDPTTSDLAQGECMLYCSDGTTSKGAAGDLLYAVNDGGTMKSLLVAEVANATAI